MAKRICYRSIKYKTCKFCDGSWHKRADCPANQRLCYKCNRLGRFTKDCLSKIKKILKTLATVCKDEEEYPYISALNNTISDKIVNVIF